VVQASVLVAGQAVRVAVVAPVVQAVAAARVAVMGQEAVMVARAAVTAIIDGHDGVPQQPQRGSR
jgi:hypothetical protein